MSIDIPTQATHTPEHMSTRATDLLRRDVKRLANIDGSSPEIKQQGVYSIGEELFLRASIINTPEALSRLIGDAFGSYFELSVEHSEGTPIDAFYTFEGGSGMTIVIIDGNETNISNLTDQEIDGYAADFRSRYAIDLVDPRKTL